MKTSLNIAENLYKLAKKEALEKGKTVSEIISGWAEKGQRLEAMEGGKKKKKTFRARSLGKPRVDLNSREHWMEVLDDRD
ncbi:MAG: hypothetical protein HYW48_12035 [Deltaproteobacteria bacterium]|nr:hypothetical protein [Deltaproteobacteria bacterium]